jgi:membrane associated rhomboid family serine protease
MAGELMPARRSSDFVTQWIMLTLAASLFTWLDGGWLAGWTCLVPSRVFHGEVWRLVTWSLIEFGPIGLVLTCVSIFKFGGELTVAWGDRRLRRFALEVVIAAAAITCVLALVTGQLDLVRSGGWAISEALTIAWARQFPTRTLVVYGLLTLSGRQLINITIAVAVLFALRGGIVAMAPELAACAIAALYPAQLLRR